MEKDVLFNAASETPWHGSPGQWCMGSHVKPYNSLYPVASVFLMPGREKPAAFELMRYFARAPAASQPSLSSLSAVADHQDSGTQAHQTQLQFADLQTSQIYHSPANCSGRGFADKLRQAAAPTTVRLLQGHSHSIMGQCRKLLIILPMK